MSTVWGRENMKRVVIWAIAGLFVLSLQGTALAQKEEKAPESMPPAMETPAPVAPAPAENTPAPEKTHKTCKKRTQKKKTQKTCKKPVPVKKKRCVAAKKAA
jgi:hypothetical protein